MRSTLIFVLFGLLSIQISLSFGQSAMELGEVIVTASRLESYVMDAPSKVTVIDKETITKSGAKNVDDLLRNVGGVDVSRRTGFTSSTSTVTLRGFGGGARGRTLVLVDGIPFNEIYSGEVYWNAISLEHIERIEVSPGALSTLYGPGAMGGVINIITKKPEKVENEVDVEYGSFVTKSFSLRHANKLNKFSYLISGGAFKTNGYMAAVNREYYDIERTKENYNINLKMLYDIDETFSVGAGYRYYDEDVGGGRKYYYGSKNLDDLDFIFKKKSNNLELLGSLYFNWEDSSWTYDRYTTALATRYQSIDYVNTNPKQGWGGNLQSNIYLADIHNVVLGMDWRRGKIHSRDEYQSTIRQTDTKGDLESIGVYLQDEIKLIDKLIIYLGGRLDYWKNFDGYLYDDTLSPKETSYSDRSDTAFSPKGGAVYHLTNHTTLRTSIGKGFRTPTLYDLYRTWKYGTTTYRANSNLNPETTYSYEVGIDQTLWDRLLGRCTFYYNDVSDLIYSIDTGSNIKDKQNVGKARTKGMEIELRYDMAKDLALFTNYTYNLSNIKEHTDKALEGKFLTYTPKNKGSFGMSYRNPKFLDIGVTSRWTRSVFTDDKNNDELKGYFVIDTTFSKKINDNFDVSLKVENLQDKKYQEYKNYLATPQTITLIGKWRF